MARLPYPEDAALSEVTRRALAGVPPLNVFRMLAHGEGALRGFLRLTGGLWNDAELSPRRRELAILHVAQLTGAGYEWHQHVAVARLCDITDAEIAAIESGDLTSFGEDDRTLLEMTAVIVRRERACDEHFEATRRVLTDRELVELHLVVAIYAGLAGLMTNLDIDLDAQLGAELIDAGDGPPRLGELGGE